MAPVKMIVAEIVPDTETPTNPMLHFQKMTDVQKKSAVQRRRYLLRLVTKLIFVHFLINIVYCSYIFSAFSLCHPDLNEYQLLKIIATGFCSLRIFYILFIAIRALFIWRFDAKSIYVAEEIQNFFVIYSGLFLALPEAAVMATSFFIVGSPNWIIDTLVFAFGQVFLFLFMTVCKFSTERTSNIFFPRAQPHHRPDSLQTQGITKAQSRVCIEKVLKRSV